MKNINVFNNASVIAQYNNGNYSVVILSDGTKIRYGINDGSDEFKPEYPESIDLCITKKCNVGCTFCYENCLPTGEHAIKDFMNWSIWQDIPAYTELAINGNDMDFPYLESFLSIMQQKKVIVNITVNWHQFLNNAETLRNMQESHKIFGIGISLGECTKLTDEDFNKYILCSNNLEHIVFHSVLGLNSYQDICRLKEHIQLHNLRILFLGYKHVGRGVLHDMLFHEHIQENIKDIEEHLSDISEMLKTVAFDNLAVEQLCLESKFPEDEWKKKYMGNDGRFSMYIDLVNQTCARNSCVPKDKQYTFTIDTKLHDIFELVKDE